MSSEGTQTKPEPFRIRLHPENDNFKSFNTVADLKDYIAKEYQFWRSHLIQGSPFVEKFKRFQDQILQVEQQTSDSQISTRISQVVTSFNNDPQLVYSETALGSFLGTLHSQDRDRAAGAFAYLRSGVFDPDSLRRRPYLVGVLLAHFSGFSGVDISPTISVEADRLQSLRASVQELLNSAQQSFQTQKESGQIWLKDIETALGQAQRNFQDLETSTQNSTQEFLSNQQNTYTNETNRLAKEHADRVSAHKKILTDIEAAYREQTRLQLPAQYWETMEGFYKKETSKWLKVAVLAGLVLTLFAFVLLFNPVPSVFDTGLSLANLRGALLTLVVLSVGAYFVALFVRLATSAQHLARDAKERLQLTHVYLALMKEGAIEPKERDIVLQAIFSRADTGLLKGDSSPTMPTPLGNLADLLKNK